MIQPEETPPARPRDSMLASLGKLLFPFECCLCGLDCEQDYPLCDNCSASLQRNAPTCPTCALPLPAGVALAGQINCGSCLSRPPPFNRVVAPWLYDEAMAHLIGQWKYHRKHWLTPLLAELWIRHYETAASLGRLNESVDVMVPVPIAPLRLLSRGFNQAGLLATAIHRRLPPITCKPPVDTTLLRRAWMAGAQVGLGARARRANTDHAFTVTRPCDNLRVAVVDDVVTTTATATAIATALKRRGAAQVEIWCLARTPRPGSTT